MDGGRRALNVFLDQNDLGANSELTPHCGCARISISRRGSSSSPPPSRRLRTPTAQELDHWFETRHDAADHLLIVLTAGTLTFLPDDMEASDGDGPRRSGTVDWDRAPRHARKCFGAD